jgi:hypothetical protein
MGLVQLLRLPRRRWRRHGSAIDGRRVDLRPPPGNLFDVIVEGRPNGMPSFGGRIPEREIWQIIAFIESMGGMAAARRPGSDGSGAQVPERRSAQVSAAPSSAVARRLTVVLLLAACTGQQSRAQSPAPQARNLAHSVLVVVRRATVVTLGVVVSLAIAMWMASGNRPERPRDEKFGVTWSLAAASCCRTGRSDRAALCRVPARPREPGLTPPAGAMKVEVIGIAGGGKCTTSMSAATAYRVARQRAVRAGRPPGRGRPEVQRRDPQLLGAQPARQEGHGSGPDPSSWFTVDQEGIYRGQCAEFCGAQHA